MNFQKMFGSKKSNPQKAMQHLVQTEDELIKRSHDLEREIKLQQQTARQHVFANKRGKNTFL